MAVLDFVPIFQETVASIRARMDADVNAGLTPDDPRWVDTREGGFYYDVTQVVILEIARLWDALALDVPAAAFPYFAWGPYLDAHATTFGLERKAAAPAAGEVLFSGDPGTTVASQTRVSAEVEGSGGVEHVEFRTTASGITGTQVARPGTMAVTPAEAGGVLEAGTYYYRVTALNDLGETDGSDEAQATIIGGTGVITLDWPDVTDATGYRVYRSTIASGPYRRIAEVLTSTYVDEGGQEPGVLGPPDLNSTAAVLLAVEAVVPGTFGNVAAGAITSLETTNGGIDQVRNPAATVGGTEVESDTALRARILAQYAPQGAGTITDYKRWALEHASVGRVTVVPVAEGPGTVQVVVLTEDGQPTSLVAVDEVQRDIDPDPGLGRGLAPIGASVEVATASIRSIDVVATVQHEPGYNLDGSGGLIGTRDAIIAALREYIDQLEVGENVVFNHVKAQFFRVTGVRDVSDVTVEGGTADVTISADPPEAAMYGSATLA